VVLRGVSPRLFLYVLSNLELLAFLTSDLKLYHGGGLMLARLKCSLLFNVVGGTIFKLLLTVFFRSFFLIHTKWFFRIFNFQIVLKQIAFLNFVFL